MIKYSIVLLFCRPLREDETLPVRTHRTVHNELELAEEGAPPPRTSHRKHKKTKDKKVRLDRMAKEIAAFYRITANSNTVIPLDCTYLFSPYFDLSWPHLTFYIPCYLLSVSADFSSFFHPMATKN